MPDSRPINTGGSAYAERGGVPQNANRRRYGDATTAERRTATSGAQVFAAARRHIDALDPVRSDPDQLRMSVARIEAEAARGEEASVPVILLELRTMAGLVPELGAALAAGLVDPTVGVAAAVRSAAEQALGRFGQRSG
jgi:hypothetical protein